VLSSNGSDADADADAVEAGSAAVDTRNVVAVADGKVTWVTAVRYNNALGRILWAVATPVHQLLVPLSLRRVDRSRPI
jgi:hypothetical protein